LIPPRTPGVPANAQPSEYDCITSGTGNRLPVAELANAIGPMIKKKGKI
jgi:hypothetical protein